MEHLPFLNDLIYRNQNMVIFHAAMWNFPGGYSDSAFHQFFSSEIHHFSWFSAIEASGGEPGDLGSRHREEVRMWLGWFWCTLYGNDYDTQYVDYLD